VSGIHHQAKHIEGQLNIFAEITCGARWIRHPERAAREIHELVSQVREELRPGYLEIHRDLIDVRIPVPEDIRVGDAQLASPPSDPRKLDEAVAETIARIRAAENPVLIGGVELFRQRAEGELLRLAEKLQVAVVTTMLAKGVFPMDHPLHMGIHIGPFSPEPIQRRVQEADLVLAFGTQLTDLNLGAARAQVPRDRSVWATERHVNVSYHQYSDVELGDFVGRLADASLPRFDEKVSYCDNLERRPNPDRSIPLTVNDLLVEVNDFLAAHPGYPVLAESGDMLFGGLEVRVPGALYLAQGYYASMGFGVPAALGAEIGSGRRPLILCGDGGFQMTGSEISHAVPKGLRPICLILNNGGWGIFRPVTERADLLEIPNWPYAELARAWGGEGIRVHTRAELAAALEVAHTADRFCVIECVTPKDDLSPISRRYIEASARRSG
jgi:indolepyruvate decarboxylase